MNEQESRPNREPVFKRGVGPLTASVFRHGGKRFSHSVTLTRSYYNREGQKWEYSHYLNASDVSAGIALLKQAEQFLIEEESKLRVREPGADEAGIGEVA